MIKVDLTQVQKGLKELRGVLSPGEIKAIGKRMLSRAATAGKTEANKRIRMEYNIKKKDLDKYLSVSLVGLNEGIAKIIASSKRIPLIYFASPGSKKPRPKTRTKTGKIIKPYVKVQIKKKTGWKILKKAFAAQMASGHKGIFVRRTKKRLPIDELKGPAVPQLLKSESVMPYVLKRIEEVAENTFNHEVKRRLEKKIKRQIKRRLTGPS